MCDCKQKDREFKVGDRIKFEYWDGIRFKDEEGVVETVGKHGYWIESNPATYGTGSIRCPFSSAKAA